MVRDEECAHYGPLEPYLKAEPESFLCADNLCIYCRREPPDAAFLSAQRIEYWPGRSYVERYYIAPVDGRQVDGLWVHPVWDLNQPRWYLVCVNDWNDDLREAGLHLLFQLWARRRPYTVHEFIKVEQGRRHMRCREINYPKFGHVAEYGLLDESWYDRLRAILQEKENFHKHLDPAYHSLDRAQLRELLGEYLRREAVWRPY